MFICGDDGPIAPRPVSLSVRLTPSVDRPFYCHHGAWVAGMPLGYFVCAGWWQVAVDGQQPPQEPYRVLRMAPHAEPAQVGPRRSVPCREGLGVGVDLDGGCPWCSRDIAQRPSGRLYRHHGFDAEVCFGSGRVPTPLVVTVELSGAVL